MILIVDDEALNRKVIQWSLKDLGHEFVHAANGQEAIDQVKAHENVALVVLDLMMPEMDGFAFLEWHREAPVEVREVPIVVNSALSDMDSIKRALKMGAYDYFTKPLSGDALEVLLPTKVQNAIQSAAAARSLRLHAEEMHAELASAMRFQTSMLPKAVDFAPLGVEYVYRPCSLVGGDFFDLYRLGENVIGLIIGDVTGHGLKAGMMSLMVRSLFREFIARDARPAVLIEELNRALLGVFDVGHYITGVYGVFDIEAGTLRFANFGHPSPYLMKNGGAMESLEKRGHFLGILDNVLIEETEIAFGEHERLVLYTDGVTETANPDGEELTPEGFSKLVAARGGDDPATWCRGVLGDIIGFHGSEEFNDDILLVSCWTRKSS
ncbi:MAG: SpoIIE family protein phosphatase [Deltaproteobacteria bacterium]|nr:SpoIIE family protein phosphatase [Deltaproteobacteria bacterium]